MNLRRSFNMAGLLALLAALALSACAIHQTVKPVPQGRHTEICVVESPSVRKGFLDEYTRALEANGLAVRLLPMATPVDACPLVSTYNARWSWDLRLYMAYAELKVFVDGKPAGEALYDATQGAGSLDKFIDAGKKIRELTDRLFAKAPAKA
jgi:hypothetical protein